MIEFLNNDSNVIKEIANYTFVFSVLSYLLYTIIKGCIASLKECIKLKKRIKQLENN